MERYLAQNMDKKTAMKKVAQDRGHLQKRCISGIAGAKRELSYLKTLSQITDLY